MGREGKGTDNARMQEELVYTSEREFVRTSNTSNL